MRLLQLAQAAIEAQGLYMRRTARGYAFQAGYGFGAAIFAIMLLVMLHIAGFSALLRFGPVWAAMIVAGVDLLLIIILGLMAKSAPNDAIAQEALKIRKEAVVQMRESGAKLLVLAPLLRSQNTKKGAIGAAITAAVVGLMSRR